MLVLEALIVPCLFVVATTIVVTVKRRKARAALERDSNLTLCGSDVEQYKYYIELRDMFTTNEPEWKLLNEKALSFLSPQMKLDISIMETEREILKWQNESFRNR